MAGLSVVPGTGLGYVVPMDEDLDEVRAVLERRIAEIRPLVEQLPRLERALAAIEGREAPPTDALAVDRPRLRLSAEERYTQILEALRHQPGLRIVDLVKEMDVSRVRIHQLTGALIEQGRVVKDPDGRMHAVLS